MATREEFGNYLLLKKLAEDPLGESFRAGRLGQQGLEQVVLLRVFNGRSLDGGQLWQGLEGRQAVQQALKSPNIGSGVDAGRVRGNPYVAYDYISGKNLAVLAAQAERESTPFPVDHSLLVVERLAGALAAAHETRHDGERVLHGFVVPHLVMISNEGETRLLGFEAGPALAAQAPSMPEELVRYLAPEARDGASTPGKSADVFSLGAILFELLTGRPLPAAAPAGGYASALAEARLADDGTALPPALAGLLEKSLAPPAERIPDAGSWHKALTRVMAESGYNPTTFNLAFFMHNLFRDEIEREGQEIEAERSLDLPLGAAGAAGASSAATVRIPTQPAVAGAATPTPVSHPTPVETPAATASGGGGKGLWIGIAAVLLLAVGAGAWWFLGRGGEAPADETAAAPVAVPAEPAGPSPDEIQAQINAMLDARTQELEESLKEDYDDRLASLQAQLEDAQEAAAERERARRAAAEQAAAAEAAREEERVAEATPPAGGAKPRNGAADAGREDAGTAADRAADATRAGVAGAGAPQEITPPATLDPDAAPVRQARAEPAAAEPAVEKPAAPAKPKEPEVKVGDLVRAGPGVVNPALVRRGDTNYPPLARRLRKQATVDVRVLVDENGRVSKAELAGKEAGFGFDQEALRAARNSTFQPATKNGVRVKMWSTIRFVFKP